VGERYRRQARPEEILRDLSTERLRRFLNIIFFWGDNP